MWSIRILNGPQAGQIFNLKQGRNIVGRSAMNDIQIISQGISKQHCEIILNKNQIEVQDLKSSNGTFVNGIRIQKVLFRWGDKISFHDIFVEVIPATQQSVATGAIATEANPVLSDNMSQSPAIHLQGMEQESANVSGNAHPNPEPGFLGVLKQLQSYIEKVALPGVYRLPELFEYRYVVMMFVALFMIMTVFLSMIPMVQITRSSILTESKRRSQSLARSLAVVNQNALAQNNFAALTTSNIETEEGVSQVFIIQQSDGMILAPASRAGTTPDLPFVHVARRENRPQTVEVDSSTVGASWPIGLFDSTTGEQITKAHAIVLYNMGSLAVDDGRVLSLFMQTLILAAILGLVIFFFLYKLIEYPLVRLNQELDLALRDKKDAVDFYIQYNPVRLLMANINSLLSRYQSGYQDISGVDQTQSSLYDFIKTLPLVGYPSALLDSEQKTIACNEGFEALLHQSQNQIVGFHLEVWSDRALQENVKVLIDKCKTNPSILHKDQLEFSGYPCEIKCQTLGVNTASSPFYLLIVSPLQQQEAA